MYVYVTKFEGKPNLIKIGKSVAPVARNSTLSNFHGAVVQSDHYRVGVNYSSVERYLHSRYSEYKERTGGDGGTEFFSESVYKDVSNYLSKYVSEDFQLVDKDFITSQLKMERKRYYNLIGKLLGHKHSSLHTGEFLSMYEGIFDMVTIEACYKLGFPPDEIHAKYVTSMSNTLTRFTTAKRVGLAYKLLKQGTAKEKSLKIALDDIAQAERSLLH